MKRRPTKIEKGQTPARRTAAAAQKQGVPAPAETPGGGDFAPVEMPSGAAGGAPKLVSEVRALPAELANLAEGMLREGATFEDVCEAVNERGGPAVTLQAVQNYYRGNLALQKSRVEFQLERVRQLKESFADPESAEAQLANAAIMLGLQSLTRKGAQLTVRDAMRARLERQNLRLKQDLLRMKMAREVEDQRLRRTKLYAEMLKWQAARIKIQQLRRQLVQEGKTKMLGPEAMEKIQEIYGLLRIPVVARDPDRKESSE